MTIFGRAECYLLRAEDFSYSLDVLSGGLGLSKLQFWIRKRKEKNCNCITLGLCICDWRICISRIFSPGKIWQIFEPYSLIDFLLYNLRILTNKRIFYYVSYNNKLAYFWSSKPWIHIRVRNRIRIHLKCWIRISIPIRIHTLVFHTKK
jgi:hypothetical protein